MVWMVASAEIWRMRWLPVSARVMRPVGETAVARGVSSAAANSGAVVSSEGLRALSGDGGDGSGGGVDAADSLVGGVSYVEIAGGVEGEAVGEDEVCCVGVAVACDGGDDAGGEVDFADAMVVRVG